MSTRLERLLFRVGLIDRASGPINQITARFDRMFSNAQNGMTKLATGGVGLYGVGRSLQSILSPAIEMDRALGEVKSLDVSSKALKLLQKMALATSITFGMSAANIVSASYDIQSAIGGLQPAELASFTQSSAILAQATKSDVATITNYVGTMYGIFEKNATAMGKGAWIEQLTGQTATAVKIFKTTGSEMASAFSNVGAAGQSFGIKTSEQMAVLGMLQATTKSGSVAGTQYVAFLQGVGKAQEEMGLKFTDSYGKMLPITNILQKIETKYGHLGDVAKGDLLMKAFGSKTAVSLITSLSTKTEDLASNIAKLGSVKGLGPASDMASIIADKWEQLAAVGNAVRTVYGQSMQQTLNPLLDKLISGGNTLTRWIQLFPNITHLAGLFTLGILALITVVSIFSIIGGLAILTSAGFGAVMSIGTGIAWLYSASIRGVGASIKLLRALALASAIYIGGLSVAFKSSTLATWLFNSALLANPITWVVLAVVGLIAALALLIYHWDAVSAAVGSFISSSVDVLVQKWQWLRGVLEGNTFLKMAFAPLLLGMDIIELLLKGFMRIPEWFAKFKNWLGGLNLFAMLGDAIDWLLAKINLIPGINIDLSRSASDLVTKTEADKSASFGGVNSLATLQPTAMPTGGLMQQIHNNSSTSRSGNYVEKIEVHTNQPVNGFALADELAMAGG